MFLVCVTELIWRQGVNCRAVFEMESSQEAGQVVIFLLPFLSVPASFENLSRNSRPSLCISDDHT